MSREVEAKREENGIKSHGKCECGTDLVCAWEWEYGAERHAQLLEERKKAEAIKEVVRIGEGQ